MPRETGGRRRDPRALEGTVRQDQVLCRETPAGGLHAEMAARPGDPGGFRVQLRRRGDPLRIIAEQVNDGVAGEEGIRLGIVVGQPGQHEREVGRVQVERVPSVLPAPPRASRRSSTGCSTPCRVSQ